MIAAHGGLDIGGTYIKAAVVAADGAVAAEDKIRTESYDGHEAVLDRAAALLRRLAASPQANFAAVGAALPGLVDHARGVSRFLPNLHSHWRDVAVADLLSARLGCGVHVLNDARAATLGELHFGQGRGRLNVTLAYFGLGTGVGGGVVIDGTLRLGPLGAAGELGHQTVLPDGPRCGCGNYGCLEVFASGPAIAAEGIRLLQTGQAPALRDQVGGDVSKVTPKAMAQAAAADASIADAIRRAARFLGIGVSNLIVTLHPDVVVIGGGVSAIGDLLMDTVRKTVRERVGILPTESVEIVASPLGTRGGMLGAAALAMRGGHIL
jgi:glucokinase